MADKLNKKDQLIVANVIEKVTLDIKHIIENAVTEALVAVRAEVDYLKTKIDTLENSLIAASIRSDDIDQYSRRDNLKIAGLIVEKNVSYADAIIEFGSQLGVHIVHTYISIAHKLTTKSKLSSTLVRFNRRSVRNDLYLARKKIKDTLNYKIYINEDLTHRRSNLLHSLKRDELTKSSWSYNGFICCTLKDNDDVILTIKLPYDLIKHYKYDINKSNSFFPVDKC